MIALYSIDEAQSRLLSPLIQAAGEVLPCTDWASFERARGRARCAVMRIDRLSVDPVFTRLGGAEHRAGGCPTVLVTDRDPDNLRLIRHVALDEVIWPEEVRAALLPAIHRACGAGHLTQVASALAHAPHLPPRLRAALVHACRSALPVHSVNDLAAAMGVDRSTLYRQWQRGRSMGTSLRLEDFLDWLTILRAVGRRSPGRKWSAVAGELGVPERTLARKTSRLLRHGLRHLDSGSYPVVAARFQEQVLNPIIICNILS